MKLPDLTDLDLSENALSDLTFLQDLPNLRHLTLTRSHLSEVRLPVGLSKLETLNLTNNRIQSLLLPVGMENLQVYGVNAENISYYSPGPNITPVQDPLTRELTFRIQGSHGTYRVETSPDLISWTERSSVEHQADTQTHPWPTNPGESAGFLRIVFLE